MGEGRKRGRQFEQRQVGTGPPPADEPASAVAAQVPGPGASGGSHRQAQASGGGAILRLWWMIIGNAVFIFSAVYVAMAGRGWRLSLVDVVYWATVGTLLAARFLDINWYRGSTSSGDPATMAHWRRYAVLLLVISVALWVGAHFVSRISAA
jgi:hypothetical protein